MCWTDEQAKEVIDKFEIQIGGLNKQQMINEIAFNAGQLCDFGPDNFSEEEQEEVVDSFIYIWSEIWKIKTNNHSMTVFLNSDYDYVISDDPKTG